MNAETRAKEIVDAENQFCEEHSLFVRGDTLDRLQAAITKALRQAENDKLEEAARVAENPGFIQARDTEWDMGVNYAKPFIANAIRSLKSKD